jgi:hypothetical protein
MDPKPSVPNHTLKTLRKIEAEHRSSRSERMLLSIVRMYVGGPLNVRSANRTSKHTWDHRTYATS